MKDQPDGVVLPSRVVPFPASISDEARCNGWSAATACR